MKKIILIIAAVTILFTFYYSVSNDDTNPEEYLQSIEQQRTEKDQLMSSGSSSPFKVYGDTIVKLKYFPIDPKYNVMARVELIETKQYLTLGSSDGSPIKYLKYANIHFKLEGQPFQLLVLKNPTSKQGGLFTAFADGTSAEETYGAGRYLDLNFKRANRISLDFNKAYNPFCNYNDSYSCPFPPKENVLPIRIEAGEKNYH